MNKWILMSLAGLGLLVSAWSFAPSVTPPTTVRVYTSGSALIGTYYTRFIPGYISGQSSIGSSVQSLVITGLANKGYSHLMVTNATGASVALVNTPYVNPYVVPTNANTNQLLVVSNNTKAWDDIPIFDAIYIKSDGSSISSGHVDIEVW